MRQAGQGDRLLPWNAQIVARLAMPIDKPMDMLGKLHSHFTLSHSFSCDTGFSVEPATTTILPSAPISTRATSRPASFTPLTARESAALVNAAARLATNRSLPKIELSFSEPGRFEQAPHETGAKRDALLHKRSVCVVVNNACGNVVIPGFRENFAPSNFAINLDLQVAAEVGVRRKATKGNPGDMFLGVIPACPEQARQVMV